MYICIYKNQNRSDLSWRFLESEYTNIETPYRGARHKDGKARHHKLTIQKIAKRPIVMRY